MLDPVAFSAGPITIYWYGIAYVVGSILAGFVMYRVQRRWNMGLTVDDVWMLVTGAVFGLIIGGRLFYTLIFTATGTTSPTLEIFKSTRRHVSFTLGRGW